MLPSSLLYPPFPEFVKEPFDFLLHIFLGYTVARVWLGPRAGWAGALGGLVPNLDWFIDVFTRLPIEHDGIFHTPVFMLGLLVVAWIARADRPVLYGFAAGFLLELFVDSMQSDYGILWLYPVYGGRIAWRVPFSELWWGTAIYLACAYLLYRELRGPAGIATPQ